MNKNEPKLINILTAVRLSGYSTERVLHYYREGKIKGVEIRGDQVSKIFFYRESILSLKRESSNKISQ